MARRDNLAGGSTMGSSPTATSPDPLAPQPNNPGMTASTGQAEGVTQDLKNEARNLANEAKEQTTKVAGQAKDFVSSALDQQKGQAADRLGSLAGVLRDTANQLQEKDGGAGIGKFADQAAGQVDRVAQYLRDRDLNTFVRDTETFARRHPDVFLGGTFLAGLLLARFLKSSADNDTWEGSPSAAYASYPSELGESRSTYGADYNQPYRPQQPYRPEPQGFGGEANFNEPITPVGG